jgi:hypothetical protein
LLVSKGGVMRVVHGVSKMENLRMLLQLVPRGVINCCCGLV